MESRIGQVAATENHFPPIVLIVDELAELGRKAPKMPSGKKAPHIEYVESIATLGRAVEVHVIAASQQNNAKVFGTRDCRLPAHMGGAVGNNELQRWD
jgi:DNA segregation ATPase FtsK/SpoIIIE-like protein